MPFFCKQWPPTIMIRTRPLQSARLAEVELVVPRAGTLANGAVRSVRLEIQLKWYCTRGASAAAAMGFEGGPGLATDAPTRSHSVALWHVTVDPSRWPTPGAKGSPFRLGVAVGRASVPGCKSESHRPARHFSLRLNDRPAPGRRARGPARGIGLQVRGRRLKLRPGPRRHWQRRASGLLTEWRLLGFGAGGTGRHAPGPVVKAL